MNTSFPKMSTSSLSQTTSQTNFYDSSPMSSYKQLTQTTNDNFKVVVRVRPPLQREVVDGRFISTVQVSPDHKKICLYEYYNIDLVDPDHLEDYLNNPNSYTMHTFSFDYVYDQDNTQEQVYDNTAKHAVLSALQGFNATIMAYGQTGTGKTFTMEGFKYNCVDPQRGIIPRAIEEIFRHISNGSNESTTFMVRVSYLQIYNEIISDLLRSDRQNLHIREDKKRGVFVEGLSEWAVRNPSEIYSLIQKGASSRATASTKMNDVSSRSHAVFIIIVEQMTEIDNQKSIKVGKLNLVDLAGSERVRVTGATGRRLEESKKINQSLSCLGNVISALIEGKTHIPYRDSKITRLLEDSLGGNCKTTMMGMISPAIDAFLETLSSVKFANRAKNIKNQPTINEDVDQKALLRKYECELQRLRKELQERNKTMVDNTKLTQLEEDRKRAEQDKNAAMAALEARSKQFFIEREEKKKLEEKIRQINSQMLIGGCNLENSPLFRNAVEEQQKLIRAQYEKKISELERERSQMEEDKVQVDRYKQLTLKQRDIMIALTTRLNERDETIVQLQDELDAYDRIHRETEAMLEQKLQRVQQLEDIISQSGTSLPNQQVLSAKQIKMKDCVTQDGQETYNITKENLQDYESQIEQLTLINQEQDSEIQRLQNLLNNHNNSNLMDFVKSSVDNIIDALSQPNDGSKLQSVAKDLISLQKMLCGEQQGQAFSNIQNTVHSRKESPLHTNYSKKSLNSSQNCEDDEQPRQLNNFYTFSKYFCELFQQITTIINEEIKRSLSTKTINKCIGYNKDERSETQFIFLTYNLLYMSNEEYVIDNLINEAKFFVDHRDDNETFLSQGQECIDKINLILKRNVRSSFLDLSQEVIINYCEACLIVPDKAHLAQQYIDLYFQRNMSQGQFYVRALFIKARLISMNGHEKLLKAEEMIKNLKLSLTYVQQGLDIINKPENKQKYGFLIYNGSLCVYNIIRPMLKPQWQSSFVDILDKIDRMFEDVDEADYDWRCRFTWLLFYCLYDDRKPDAFKLLDRLWETTKKKGDCDFQNSLLRLRIHIGKEYKQALDSAFKESESAPSEKAWKSLFMLQKMRSGLIPEAQVEKELINLINSISSAVLPGNEVAATNKLAPVFQERLAESGRVALQFNLVNIADSITNFLGRVRQLHQKAYILHEYNKAELYIKKAGPLIDNKTGMRLNSLQIKMQEVERRIEALKIMEKVMVTNKKLNDPDLIFEGAVLIWNISLPFLNAQYRVHVYKAFSMACQLLEQLQCVDHALRVNFHIELAKSDLQEDLAVKAEAHIKKALSLDYSVPLGKVQFKYDEGEDLGLYQRPYDKYLRNLEEKIRLKLNIYQEPKNDIERVITQLENVQAAKSENLRIDILQKCLGTIVNLQEQEYWYDTKLDLVEEEQNREKVLRKQENLYQFKQKKLLAAEIARLAFEWEFNDLAFKACEFVCSDTWDMKNSSEMILAQVECYYRMAQMIIDNLIKDNFEIPFSDPIRVEETDNPEDLGQDKKDQVLSLKRKMCANFVKGLKLADSIKQTWLVFNGAIYIWNNFLTIFRNPINDSKLLPEITNLLKEFFEIMKNSLKEIEKKLINDYDIDTKIQVLANIGLVYARLMEGKSQYDEVMRVCEALLLTPLSPHTRKLINSIKARVSGTAKTSAAKPGTQQDKKGGKPAQSSSDSVIFDVVSQLEIIQNSTNKAQTQDLIKKCFETLVGWTAKENDETELELHAELWARLARLALNEETTLMYKYSLRCVQFSLQLLTADLSTIPASRLRWYSLAEYIYSENLLRMLNTETQETESQESLLFSSLFHAIEAANKGLKAGINSLVLDAAKQVWNLCARLEESAQNRKHLIKPVYSCLNYLKECKEKSEPDLVLLLAQLLFKSALENEDFKLGEQAADMVFELVPKNMQKPIWEAKMIFMSKQGKNELQAIVNMKEADASLQAKVWIRLARVSNNLYKQYTAYNKAIELLKKDSSVEIVEVLIEFSEWLLRNGNEKQLVIENLMVAADTLIDIEIDEEDEEEDGDEEQNSSTIFSRSTRGKKSTVSKQSKQKSKLTKKTGKNTVKQKSKDQQKSQISGQKSSNQRFSRAANVRTTKTIKSKQSKSIFKQREEEANPNRLNCAHYERLMRIHIMLAMIADTMEQSIQYALDAKVFLVKIIEISFQTMNEFDENAAKYTNIIDEKTGKQQQQAKSQQEDFQPRYLLPTCITDWIKLTFSKDFLDRVKSYEDYNFMGKFLFDKAQLTYTYINHLVTIFEKYGLQVHNIPLFVFQKFFVKEILNNQYLDKLIDVRFSKCLHQIGFHLEGDTMYVQSNIGKFKLSEQERKQLLAKTESSVLQQNRSRPADIMEQNLPQANVVTEIQVYKVLTELGSELLFQGEVFRAKELLSESHKHAKIVSDLELMGRILCLQGQVAYLEGEFKDSIENHKLSHKLIKDVSQWEASAIQTFRTLCKLGKYDDVRQFLKQITEVLLEVLNKPNYQPNKLSIYQTLTSLYVMQARISMKDLFKEFQYDIFKQLIDNLEKALKCIQHGGFMTHQIEMILNLVNKVLLFIRNRNYTLIDQIEIYFKMIQRLQNAVLKPLEQQSRSLLKYTLLIERESESIRSPLMDLQAKVRVVMASCFTEMGLMKWIRKQNQLPDLQASDDDGEGQEEQAVEQMSDYEPLQKYLLQLTIKIQRAIQPLPQRLESFEKACAILLSTMKQLRKDSFWFTIAEIELVRAKRYLAISKKQLDDVWESSPIQQEEEQFDYKTDALQGALKLIKDLEARSFLKNKKESSTIPLEWGIFQCKQMHFYLKILYESALDVLGTKSPEVSYDYLCKYQHFAFCEQMFSMVRQSFFGKHKMIVYIRLIKMIYGTCGYLSQDSIKLITEANKLWDNLTIFPLTELYGQLQQAAGFLVMQFSQNKTYLYLGYLHNVKQPTYKINRIQLTAKIHDQMRTMKSNLDQIKNNLIKTPIIQQQDFIKLEDEMEKEYTKFCVDVESFMHFIENLVDEQINTQEEVPPQPVDPKAPPPKKDQGKQSKGKPGKDEVALYESTLEMAPGKIDTVVLLIDPKFFDYPLEQLRVFHKVIAISRDFSMPVYVRRLKNVGFQVALNNSAKGIEKDKLKYITYDFKVEETELNLTEFNLQKTLTDLEKQLPQLKFEGTYSQSRLASLGELQKYSQTGSSLYWYGSPAVLNILSSKVILDLSEINTSRFWVIFDKMNAKKSLIDKFTSLDPDGEKTHILEQSFKISVLLTLIDVSTILTTQWSPQTLEYLRAFENLNKQLTEDIYVAACLQRYKAPIVKYEDENGNILDKKPQPVVQKGAKVEVIQQDLKEIQIEKKRIYTHNFIFVGLPNLRLI